MRGFWQRFLLADRGVPMRYGVAVGMAAFSLLLVHLLNRLEHTQLSSFAFLSVVLVALYGGMGPALLAAGLTAVGIDYFFAEPRFHVFDTWGSTLRVLTYVTAGVLVGSVVASLREAYRDLMEQHYQTEEAKRAREDVLAIVSHDLRSPLSAILLSVEYMKRLTNESAPADELRPTLEGLHRSADRMRRLVDDLLDAAAIDAGRLKIDRQLHDLAPIVEDALETARSAAEAKGIRLTLDLPLEPVFVDCDRERMTQVVSNVVGNAVKFSPEGAIVQIAVEPSAHEARVTVRDCGSGIPAEEIPRLFDRYWQAETSRRGTGLGLYIAKSLVEAHGGRIEVDSRVGRGSAFTVALPRRPGRDGP